METRKNVNRIFIYGLLTVLAILVVIPFGWMLLASVKTSNEVFSIPMRLLPKEFQWVNYQTIWEKIPLLTFFKNTFKIADINRILALYQFLFLTSKITFPELCIKSIEYGIIKSNAT